MYIADAGLQRHPLRQSLPQQLLLPSFLLQSVLKDAVHLFQSQLVPGALDTATPQYQSHPFVNSGDSFRQQGLFVPTKPRAFSCIRGGLVPSHVSSFNVNTSYSLLLGRSTVCPSYHQILEFFLSSSRGLHCFRCLQLAAAKSEQRLRRILEAQHGT